MIRTFSEFSAMMLTFAASVFLLKGNLLIGVEVIAELAQTRFDYSIPTIQGLATQQADTRVGLAFLLMAFLFQLRNSLVPVSIGELGSAHRRGIALALAFSILVGVAGWYVSHRVAASTASEAIQILEASPSRGQTTYETREQRGGDSAPRAGDGGTIRGPFNLMLIAMLEAAVPHLLALAITLGSGWLLYRHSQRKALNRSLSALLFDSSQNLAVLQRVMKGETWTSDSMSPLFPDSTASRALLSEASLHTNDVSRGLVFAIHLYAYEMDGVRLVMNLMFDRMKSQRVLSAADLKILDSQCQTGAAIARVLQRFLDAEIERRGIRIGTVEQGKSLNSDMKEELERVRSEFTRPASE